MIKVFLASVVAVGGLALSPGVATADPLCSYRSAAHSAEHGGVNADSAWHVAHGELPTCKPAEKHDDGKPRPNDEGLDWWRRDKSGFHCTWRGCG